MASHRRNALPGGHNVCPIYLWCSQMAPMEPIWALLMHTNLRGSGVGFRGRNILALVMYVSAYKKAWTIKNKKLSTSALAKVVNWSFLFCRVESINRSVSVYRQKRMMRKEGLPWSASKYFVIATYDQKRHCFDFSGAKFGVSQVDVMRWLRSMHAPSEIYILFVSAVPEPVVIAHTSHTCMRLSLRKAFSSRKSTGSTTYFFHIVLV